MDQSEVLEELKGIAERLDMRVMEADFRGQIVDTRSGSCELKGKKVIIVDRALPDKEKSWILAKAMADSPLDGFYISPFVRALLDRAQAEIPPTTRVGSQEPRGSVTEQTEDPDG